MRRRRSQTTSTVIAVLVIGLFFSAAQYPAPGVAARRRRDEQLIVIDRVTVVDGSTIFLAVDVPGQHGRRLDLYKSSNGGKSFTLAESVRLLHGSDVSTLWSEP